MVSCIRSSRTLRLCFLNDVNLNLPSFFNLWGWAFEYYLKINCICKWIIIQLFIEASYLSGPFTVLVFSNFIKSEEAFVHINPKFFQKFRDWKFKYWSYIAKLHVNLIQEKFWIWGLILCKFRMFSVYLTTVCTVLSLKHPSHRINRTLYENVELRPLPDDCEPRTVDLLGTESSVDMGRYKQTSWTLTSTLPTCTPSTVLPFHSATL